MKLQLLIIAAILLVTCTACVSGGPVPADKLSRSQAAVRAAQEMGAERNPTGSIHLRNAREELARGRKLIVDGEQGKATTMLLRAEADAELAMNVTRESAALAEAQATRDEVRALRSASAGTSTTTKEGN